MSRLADGRRIGNHDTSQSRNTLHTSHPSRKTAANLEILQLSNLETFGECACHDMGSRPFGSLFRSVCRVCRGESSLTTPQGVISSPFHFPHQNACQGLSILKVWLCHLSVCWLACRCDCVNIVSNLSNPRRFDRLHPTKKPSRKCMAQAIELASW